MIVTDSSAGDLLVTGTIYTLDGDRPTVGALLARGGRVIRLGTELECRRAAFRGARHVSTGAGCAIPGFADAHGHVVLYARSLREVRCEGAAGEDECVRRAALRARAQPAGTWIRGRGWDETRWESRALPTERPLSAALPDHFVALERVDGHAVWVNARALALAGIDASTPDPPGGRVVRDRSGRPTGVLVDAAQELVTGRAPQPHGDELMELILSGLERLAQVGLTAVHDAGCSSSVLRAYAALAEADRLPVRVYAMIDGSQPEGSLRAELARWAATRSVGRLEVRAVKLFADGALGSRGAALLDGYADDPGNRGLLLLEPGALRARIREIVAARYQPAVHAIGDRACREVLGAYAELAQALPVAPLRPRVEHLQLVRAEDLQLASGAGVVASMQPAHAVGDAPWVAARVGDASPALRGAYAWRQVLRTGAPLALGSDFPVERPEPLLGMAAAEERRPAGWERPWMPEERLERAEALRGFTTGPAFAAFAERRRGTLRPGADADLTVLGADVFAVRLEELAHVPILATIVAGRVEHQATS